MYVINLVLYYAAFEKCWCFPFQNVACEIKQKDGSVDKIELAHTMNDGQILWFRAGSALNRMAEMKWSSCCWNICEWVILRSSRDNSGIPVYVW